MSHYKALATPERCYADFCLIPVGTGSASVAEEVAEVQKLLAASGLRYTMHSAGTTVEGSWDDVMRVIGQAHSAVHARASLASRAPCASARDREDKVKRVEQLLAKE